MTNSEIDTRAAGAGDDGDGDLTPLPEPGAEVGGYRITSVAGSGGMGVVYRARDPELDRDVALKLIAPEYARDPSFRALFIRESLAAAALEHPHVVPVYRAGEDGGRLYTAMRFVEGESLAARVARGPVPPALVVRLLTQVASALDAAHGKGLVHRDVKPGNILVGGDEGDETAYLTDFGLALRTGAADPSEGWAGTVAYLAPEQATGGALDARTDVYALGCVLFHALTGRVPFPADDREGAIVAHLTSPPPTVSDVAPNVPRGFDAVVRRAMEKNPADRFASAREFAEALAALGFDVYLAHDGETAELAEGLAAVLRDRGLDVAPEGLDALRTSSACAVLVGPGGLGPWAAPVLAATTDISARDRGFRTVGVLCPGAPDTRDVRVSALAGRPWVDLRDGEVEDGIRGLLRALGVEYASIAASLGADTCPYPGLAAFGEDTADLFVGREDDTEALVARLDGRRFLAVSGPSGSGKSSLLAAGLVPAVRGGALPGTWRVTTLTPGARPSAALDAAIAGLRAGTPSAAGADALHRAAEDALGDGERLLVVVDQFEEIFTLCRDEADRRAFVDRLLFAATVPGGRVSVVLAMRADFIGHCAAYENLRVLVGDSGFLVGGMTAASLRRAVEVPAKRAGLQLEPGLTRRIVADVGDRPGTLPLVQQLLVELWHRRRGNELTLEAYASSGGVEGALARRADAVLDSLSEEHRRTARRVMLRLTQPGEGTENTRRRALRSELVTAGDGPEDVDAVVGAFADARLVTTAATSEGVPTVEVAHEALIRSWPRLREWIDEDREALRRQHRLSEAADEWERTGRDEALLFRGSRLVQWEERDPSALNATERAFLAASVARRDRSERARRRRTRATIAGLTAGIALVGAAGGYALLQRNAAEEDRDRAQSRQLAVSSREQAGNDPELSLLLAGAALDADATREAEAEFRRAAAGSHVVGAYRGHEDTVYDVAASRDGSVIATASSDDTVRFWNRDGTPRRTIRFAGDVFGVALSADGGTAATAGIGDGLVVIDTRTGRRRSIVRTDLYTSAISADGRRVAATDAAGVLTEWDTRSGRVVRALGTHPGGVFQVSPTPEGGWVTSGASEGSVYVWPARGTGAPAVYRAPRSLNDVAVSPDGRWIAATGQASPSALFVWRAGATDRPPRTRVLSSYQELGVSFSPDSQRVAVTGGDGRVRLVPVAGGGVLRELVGHTAIAYRARFLPDGELVSASDDGTALRWRWDEGIPRRTRVVTPTPPGQLSGRQVRIGADGAVTAVRGDGGVVRWDAGDGTRIVQQPPAEGPVNDVTLTPGGRRLVWTGTDSALRFDPSLRPARPYAIPALAQGDQWQGAAVTDDGTRAAAATYLGRVVEWDLRRGGQPRTVVDAGGFTQFITVLSPTGRTLVVGAFDGTARVWGEDRGEPRILTGHSGSINAADVTADDRYLVTGGDRTVRVWDLATGANVATLRGHSDVTDVAFGPDGERVVSAGSDGVRVWDWRRETQLAVFTDPSAPAAAALGADGMTVAAIGAAGSENVLVLWTCLTCGPLDAVRERADDRTTRALTPDERAQFNVDP